MCHCCGCCCHPLLGISRFGYENSIVTSSFIAKTGLAQCKGCGMCASACPIEAISMHGAGGQGKGQKKAPKVDLSICLGCGVCALKCKTGAIRLVKRDKRVLHPETTFERLILQCLERGTLQNQLFDDPGNLTQKFLRGAVGGFLRLPPVKMALMSDALRSRFLSSLKNGIRKKGMGWVLKV